MILFAEAINAFAPWLAFPRCRNSLADCWGFADDFRYAPGLLTCKLLNPASMSAPSTSKPIQPLL